MQNLPIKEIRTLQNFGDKIFLLQLLEVLLKFMVELCATDVVGDGQHDKHYTEEKVNKNYEREWNFEGNQK
jgi:hypothetical protein